MSNTTLILHKGARAVTREELAAVPVPPSTNTWFPIGHVDVIDRVTDALGHAGFTPTRVQTALSRDNGKLFGVIDLTTPIVPTVTLAVGVRNSIDRSLPISFCAGNRVFCCDNLAFNSEIVVARKHTRHGEMRFGEAIALAIGKLRQFQQKEHERIDWFQHAQLTEEKADALILRSFEKEIITGHRLPEIIAEWRKPTFEEFAPRTFWSLENAYTTVLGDLGKKSPQRYAAMTMALQGFLTQASGLKVEPVREALAV